MSRKVVDAMREDLNLDSLGPEPDELDGDGPTAGRSDESEARVDRSEG